MRFKFISSFALLIASSVVTPAAIIQINGQFNGNDDEATVEAAIFATTGEEIDLSLYDKSDGAPVLANYTGDNGSITDSKNGTWDVIDSGVLIDYFTVKAGNSFTVWLVDPGANSGTWTTAGITVGNGQQPNLSHLTLWTSDGGGGPSEVPEPSYALAISALAGMGLLRKFLTR